MNVMLCITTLEIQFEYIYIRVLFCIIKTALSIELWNNFDLIKIVFIEMNIYFTFLVSILMIQRLIN